MSLTNSKKKQLLEAAREHISCISDSLDLGIREAEKYGGMHKDRVSSAEIHEALMQDVLTAIGIDINTQKLKILSF